MTRDELVTDARTVIEAGSKSFRAASQLFDRTTRERAWLLYRWCRHCDDVCDGQVLGFAGGRKSAMAGVREQTLLAASGQPVEGAPFQALRQLLRECPIPTAMLTDHLEGFELDERGWAPRTEEDLDRYCYHVAGVVGCMMAVVMGVAPEDRATLDRAADLGIAFQLSNIARDLREDHEAGRCYVPEAWLDEAGIARSALFAPEHAAARMTIVDRLVARVELYERRARGGVGKLGFRSRVAVLAAARIYGAIGRSVRAGGDAAWDRRATVGKVRKLAYLVPSFAEAAIRRP